MAGFNLTFCPVSPFAVMAGEIGDIAVRSFTGGCFGFVPWIEETDLVFVFEEPVSEFDRASGGFCAVTGYWAPGSRLVRTSRGMAIDIFAPNDHR